METRNCLIFAAGLGTRLKPITDTMPKAMVPVGGKPLVQRLLEKLRREGFSQVVINVHHFADQIEGFVKANDGFGLDVRFSDERAMLLDTGGGVRRAARLFDSPHQPFLIHNVDILSHVRLARFLDKSVEGLDLSLPFARLLVSRRKTSRYLLFNEENRLVGWTNIQTGEVKTPYPHLEVARMKKYAFSGIHVFSPRLLPWMESWGERFPVIDFYLSVCHQVPIYGSFRPVLKLLDVGKLDSLEQAERFVQP